RHPVLPYAWVTLAAGFARVDREGPARSSGADHRSDSTARRTPRYGGGSARPRQTGGMEAKLISSEEIAPGVRHFIFEALGVDRLEFDPGRFTSFTEEMAGKKITRASSLASAPSGTNRFDLCLNRVEQGHLSPRLFGMQLGETIEMREPLGQF